MSDSGNIDIKHLAHSLLNREQHPKTAPAAHVPELKPAHPLPKHILSHASEYIGKLINEKRKIQQ